MTSLIKGSSTTAKQIGNQLKNIINDIPLQNLTKDRIESIISRSCQNDTNMYTLHKIAELFQLFETNRHTGDKRLQHKAIESLIWHTYFQWDNIVVPLTKKMSHIATLPPHLQPLLRSGNGSNCKSYNDLISNWPTEYHYDILHSRDLEKPVKGKSTKGKDNSKIITLRNMWIQGHPNAVPATTAHINNNSHGLIKPILDQIYFINNTLWKNSSYSKSQKAILPIVEVPLTVHGTSIPKVRIKNLVKDKLNTVTTLLIKEWPALYNNDNIAEMLLLSQPSPATNSSSTNRDIMRCYQRCFYGKMYKLTDTGQYHVVEQSST